MLKKNRKGYLYLLPAILILGIFVFYPIINTIIFSFDETKAKGFVLDLDLTNTYFKIRDLYNLYLIQ